MPFSVRYLQYWHRGPLRGMKATSTVQRRLLPALPAETCLLWLAGSLRHAIPLYPLILEDSLFYGVHGKALF